MIQTCFNFENYSFVVDFTVDQRGVPFIQGGHPVHLDNISVCSTKQQHIPSYFSEIDNNIKCYADLEKADSAELDELYLLARYHVFSTKYT